MIHQKNKDWISISKEVQQENELQLIKKLIPHNNHILWEINRSTLEVKPAAFNLVSNYALNWKWKKGDPIQGKKSLIVNHGCEYVLALSKDNALKKFEQNKDGSRYQTEGTLKFY
jgi:hypothetical protein